MLDLFVNKHLNVEILMILATIGSAIIGFWAKGAMLIFIFALSGALETYSKNKSEKELASLLKLQPNEATLLTAAGNKWFQSPACKSMTQSLSGQASAFQLAEWLQKGCLLLMNLPFQANRCPLKNNKAMRSLLARSI